MGEWSLVKDGFLEEGGQSSVPGRKGGTGQRKRKGEEIYCRGTPCWNQEKVKCKLKTVHPR